MRAENWTQKRDHDREGLESVKGNLRVHSAYPFARNLPESQLFGVSTLIT